MTVKTARNVAGTLRVPKPRPAHGVCLLLWAGGAAALLWAAAAVGQPGGGDGRAQLLQAYSQIAADYRARLGEGGTPAEAARKAARANVVPAGNPVSARNVVKFWGELENGTKVNLARYQWRPKERFYLCTSSALPVRLIVQQEYPEARNKSPDTVIPDKEVPGSYDVLPPGQVAKSFLLETDDTDDEEHWLLTVTVVGSSEEQQAESALRERDDFQARSKLYGERMADVAAAARKQRLEMVRYAPRANTVDTGRVTSTNPDDVAVLAVCEKDTGFVRVKALKR